MIKENHENTPVRLVGTGIRTRVYICAEFTSVLSFEDSDWSRELMKMECQMEKLEHFRYILLFELNRGAKAAEAARNICVVYGDNAIGDSTPRKWFSPFKEDRFDINDTPRSGRPSWFYEDCLNTLIHSDSRQCTRELKM